MRTRTETGPSEASKRRFDRRLVLDGGPSACKHPAPDRSPPGGRRGSIDHQIEAGGLRQMGNLSHDHCPASPPPPRTPAVLAGRAVHHVRGAVRARRHQLGPRCRSGHDRHVAPGSEPRRQPVVQRRRGGLRRRPGLERVQARGRRPRQRHRRPRTAGRSPSATSTAARRPRASAGRRTSASMP